MVSKCKLILMPMFIFIYISCENPANSELYTGITETDEFGNIIGEIDTNDWVFLNSSNNTDNDYETFPEQYLFGPAYPNPSIDTVYIPFSIPQKVVAIIEIFNSKNQSVKTLVNSDLAAGYYRIPWDVTSVQVGIYRAKIETPDFSAYGDIKVEDN